MTGIPTVGDLIPPDQTSDLVPPLWVACEATTGKIIEYFPTLVAKYPLKRTLGRYETVSAVLPIVPDRTPPVEAWMRATKPGATFWAALTTSPGSIVYDRVLWAGLGLARTRALKSGGNSGRSVQLSLATLEAYFDRRYVGFLSVATQQSLIVKQLVETYVRTGALPGLPIRVVTLSPGPNLATGWQDTDDKTVYSVMQSISNLLGGVEWTVEWEMQTDPERVTPVLYVGERIGQATPAGQGPAATFALPGPVTDVEYVEDYSAGKGANDVLAVASGQGTARAQSARYRSLNYDNRPTYEYRGTPDTSQQQQDILNTHASAWLSVLTQGSKGIALTADRARAPRLIDDWNLGDDVGYDLDDEWLLPDHPHGTRRCISWEWSPNSVTPFLAVPELN